MPTLLHVDASSRADRWYTRWLSRLSFERWLGPSPNDEIIYRDIGPNPPLPRNRRVDCRGIDETRAQGLRT